MKKQYKSSLIKNHKITHKSFFFKWCSLRRLRSFLSYFRFFARNKKKKKTLWEYPVPMSVILKLCLYLQYVNE